MRRTAANSYLDLPLQTDAILGYCRVIVSFAYCVGGEFKLGDSCVIRVRRCHEAFHWLVGRHWGHFDQESLDTFTLQLFCCASMNAAVHETPSDNSPTP